MFFAATRQLIRFSFFLSRQRSQCDVGRRKLKFQIVYNYFSINCHTLHRAQLHKQIQIQSNILLVFSLLVAFELWNIFLARYLFSGFLCVFFLSEKINYLQIFDLFLFSMLLHLIQKLFSCFFTLCLCAKAMNFTITMN